MPRTGAGKRGRRGGSQAGSTTRTVKVKELSKEEKDTLAVKVAEEVESRLGLEGIVDREKLVSVVRDVVESISESRSSKPTVDVIVKRIQGTTPQFLKALAAMLLEDVGRLDARQLEFVVSNAPELAGRAAPVLYRRAVEVGAHHVIDSLRHLWAAYGNPTPITCPRCGFRAVTPDLTCIVCGATLREEEVKASVGFKELLRAFAEKADPRLVEEVVKAGFVLLDHEINPPSLRSSLKFYVEIGLSRDERESVKSILSERLSKGRS